MLSGILIFNQKGENLIFRSFRSDCRPRLADIFRIQVISNVNVRSPILTLGSTTFSHIRHENIYLVAVTKSNANAALVFEFLERLRGLGKAYFGKFDEEGVKNNFVLVYELLDGESPFYTADGFGGSSRRESKSAKSSMSWVEREKRASIHDIWMVNTRATTAGRTSRARSRDKLTLQDRRPNQC